MSNPLFDEANAFHAANKGKISIQSKVPLNNSHDLSLAYSPGVANPCIEIHKDPKNAYLYTSKGNIVAVITDGSAVLGLGDIGPEAAMPVMEGKALLFKKFANIDSIPLCVDTKDVDEFVETVQRIAPSFGGINLEDISAPRCFVIEQRLKELLDIPVFHDDQHGTAIVTIAGLINSLKLTNKTFEDITVVINGAGAAGVAIADLLKAYNTKEVIICDRSGIIHQGRSENMPMHKVILSQTTNPHGKTGSLQDAIKGADVFIGVSQAKQLTQEMVKEMAPHPLIFALANPVPEIMPEEAKEAGALIVCTGRSDFPNQVNNALVFPGIFRGALDVHATAITEEMKLAAAEALAQLVTDEELTPDYIIPNIFDERVVPAVTKAVQAAAIKQGVAKTQIAL